MPQLLYLLPVSLIRNVSFGGGAAGDVQRHGAEGKWSAPFSRTHWTRTSAHCFFIVPRPRGVSLPGGRDRRRHSFNPGAFTSRRLDVRLGRTRGLHRGLLAATLGRLYSSTYYALRDTRTPLKFAVLRVVLTTALGWAMAIPLPPALGLDLRWGVAGLTVSAGLAGWLEFALLRRTLNRRIGTTGLPPWLALKLWTAAGAAAGAGWLVKLALGRVHPVVAAALILAPYGAVYFGVAAALRVDEARAALRRLRVPRL